VTLIAPVRSNPPEERAARGARGMRRTAATRSAADIRAGAKNTHRQSIAVSTPPTTSPSEKPPAAVPA